MAPFDMLLKIRNYKNFGDPVGYEAIKPLNIIIGRNNVGKSSLIDLVNYACSPKPFPRSANHGTASPEVLLTRPVREDELKRVFPESTSGGEIGGNHWSSFGRHLIGTEITVQIQPKGDSSLVKFEPDLSFWRRTAQGTSLKVYWDRIAAQIGSPLKGRMFKKLSAERDIVIEKDDLPLEIGSNGVGFTTVVTQIRNRSAHPTDLIEKKLLQHLNAVFAPDSRFTFLDVQQHESGAWEIYLEEKDKGRIALSQSGSGLKTIFLVASYFVLLPYIHKKALSEIVFAFEELENNLHPALQRRLLAYIRKTALEEGCLVFLTTHSSTVIDQFSHDADAQIIHVAAQDGHIRTRTAKTYVEHRGILDDLDVRASDLLQANGIVWVEGPSDRLYFNRWIDLYSEGALKEGTHYQCVFYGGRLLAHLAADDPEIKGDEVLKILRVNRNAIIIADSDKGAESDGLNATKTRLVAEIEGLGGVAWVTKGREIENYLALPEIQAKFAAAISPPGQYENFSTYLDRLEAGQGVWFVRIRSFLRKV